MAERGVPSPPAGTKASGRRLWRSVVDVFDLEEHELALLRQAVHTVDQLDELEALVAADGLMVEGRGGLKLHPAAVEARQLKIALARLLAVLRLPTGDAAEGGAGARQQRRVGARGVYPGGLRAVNGR